MTQQKLHSRSVTCGITVVSKSVGLWWKSYKYSYIWVNVLYNRLQKYELHIFPCWQSRYFKRPLLLYTASIIKPTYVFKCIRTWQHINQSIIHLQTSYSYQNTQTKMKTLIKTNKFHIALIHSKGPGTGNSSRTKAKELWTWFTFFYVLII